MADCASAREVLIACQEAVEILRRQDSVTESDEEEAHNREHELPTAETSLRDRTVRVLKLLSSCTSA